MCPFLFQRTHYCEIVAACVFWGLILSNPQPSDGVVPDGGYGTFHDHYGDNLEGLAPGDVFEKENYGGKVFIYDNEYYFQMHLARTEESQRDLQCFTYKYPKKGQAMRRLKKIGRVPYYYPTIALINHFQQKHMPFHWNYCNKHDYMNYILYGKLTKNENFKECPLAAPWVGLHESVIRSGNFKLKDFNGVEHAFGEYWLSKEPAKGAESSKQGATFDSSKRLKKSETSLIRAGSLEGMVIQPVPSRKRKREPSV